MLTATSLLHLLTQEHERCPACTVAVTEGVDGLSTVHVQQYLSLQPILGNFRVTVAWG